MDEQHGSDDRTPSDPRARARELFRRTAPVLRDVNQRIEQNEALRETRDALVDRAGGLVQKADEALGRMTAIEGTVVERDETAPTRPAHPAARAATSSPEPSTSRDPHWTKQRLARMASAAATEAVRPARPLIRRETKTALLVGAIAGIFFATVMRRR